jgi:uncharacterized protein YdaU (DUF1376 family)
METEPRCNRNTGSQGDPRRTRTHVIGNWSQRRIKEEIKNYKVAGNTGAKGDQGISEPSTRKYRQRPRRSRNQGVAGTQV